MTTAPADQGTAVATAGQRLIAVQGTLDELGSPLSEVTFVVVDLETTGGSPKDCGITEIGAVKVRGGEVVGEFQTLVNPGVPIPPFIAVLTGITDAMVATAPGISAVLPSFLEFAAGAVLVAHNAPFDISFLRAACAGTGSPWPGAEVVDTVRLARLVLDRGEVRNHKLGTLARYFRSRVVPEHRALGDARATVDVLHGLLERVGNQDIRSLEELRSFTSPVPAPVRRKRHLADGLPHAPGVYLFRDRRDRVLYVGTSVDIRARVASYFTAAERRGRMTEMISLAERVTPVVCATALEARVRELRLIAEHAPPYNRRSRFPDRVPWVKLTVESFPRLSIVREVRHDGSAYIGPFTSRSQAELAVDALHDAFPLRRCHRRLPGTPAADATSCALAEMGRCGAPCVGGTDRAGYAEVVDAVRRAFVEDATTVTTAVLARVESLAGQERFEEAGVHRDRLLAYLAGAARAQRLTPLATAAELVAARRTEPGGWELVLVRHGRLSGTTVSPPGADPQPAMEALRATGEVVAPPPPPMPAAHPEETEEVLRWLERPGIRLVALDGSWWCPITGAAAVRARLDAP